MTKSNIIKRVAEISGLINQAIADDIMAIECDSTWETGYNYKSIELMKTKIKVTYEVYNGVKIFEMESDSVQLSAYPSDIAYFLTNIKRQINKGYREAKKTAIREAREEAKNNY